MIEIRILKPSHSAVEWHRRRLAEADTVKAIFLAFTVVLAALGPPTHTNVQKPSWSKTMAEMTLMTSARP
jgi:hypothetical protein